jgi:hypothetical protein
MHQKGDRIAGVLRVGGVFEVAVVARYDERAVRRIQLLHEVPKELVEF